MVIYNNSGYGVIVYQERFLTAEELANSIPVTEEELADMDNTKVLRTDGKTWWYEEIPEPTEPIEQPITEMEKLRADVDFILAMEGFNE